MHVLPVSKSHLVVTYTFSETSHCQFQKQIHNVDTYNYHRDYIKGYQGKIKFKCKYESIFVNTIPSVPDLFGSTSYGLGPHVSSVSQFTHPWARKLNSGPFWKLRANSSELKVKIHGYMQGQHISTPTTTITVHACKSELVSYMPIGEP